MASKLIFLAFLAVLMLRNVHGEDDFKEVDDEENGIREPENDEEFEPRLPRMPLRFGRFGRFRSRSGSARSSRFRFGTRSRTSRSSFRTVRTSTRSTRTRGSIFRRNTGRTGRTSIFRRNTGRIGTGRTSIFRRNTARTGSGGFRLFRRNTGGRTGSGGFRLFRRNTGGRTGSGGFRIFRRNTRSGSGKRFFRRTRKTRKTTTTDQGGESTWSKIGTVVSILSLGSDIVSTTLRSLSNVEKKIVLSIANLEGVRWEGGTVYMSEGNNVKALPNTVEITEGVLMAGEKKTGYSRTGVAGVVCYRMQDVSKSFCLMYKVPWSGDNYWNIKIYDGNKAASSSVYNELQSGALKGGSSVAKKDLGTGEYTVTNDDGSKQKTPYTIFMKDASMTNSDGATLQVSLGVKITGIPAPKVDDTRKIRVELKNDDGADWQDGTLYMNEGADNSQMPKSVTTGDRYEIDLLQKDGETKKGVSGVICYNFADISKSFCLMFKVPHNVDNKWNVKVYEGEKQANADVYNDLQAKAIDGGNAIDRRDLYEGTLDGTSYKIFMKQCNMSNSPKSTLQVTVGLELA